jgi:hypothetical protein
MKRASKRVFSTSAPQNSRTCPRSAAGPGEKFISPRPRMTRAVGPSSVGAMKAVPEGIVRVRSTARSVRFLIAYSRVRSSASR